MYSFEIQYKIDLSLPLAIYCVYRISIQFIGYVEHT